MATKFEGMKVKGYLKAIIKEEEMTTEETKAFCEEILNSLPPGELLTEEQIMEARLEAQGILLELSFAPGGCMGDE